MLAGDSSCQPATMSRLCPPTKDMCAEVIVVMCTVFRAAPTAEAASCHGADAASLTVVQAGLLHDPLAAAHVPHPQPAVEVPRHLW